MKMRFYKAAWYRFSGSVSKFEDDKTLVCEIVAEALDNSIHAVRLTAQRTRVVGIDLPAVCAAFDAWKTSAQRMASMANIEFEVTECDDAGYYAIFDISPIYLSQPYPDPVMLDLRRACFPLPIRAVSEKDALLKHARMVCALDVSFTCQAITGGAKMLVCRCIYLKAQHNLVAKNVKDFSG